MLWVVVTLAGAFVIALGTSAFHASRVIAAMALAAYAASAGFSIGVLYFSVGDYPPRPSRLVRELAKGKDAMLWNLVLKVAAAHDFDHEANLRRRTLFNLASILFVGGAVLMAGAVML